MVKTYVLNVDFLNDDAEFKKYYKMLSQQRKSRVDRLHFRNDKNLSLGAAILLDRFLTEKGRKLENTELSYGENEKPYIKGAKDLSFNLSHSGSVAVLSCANGPVGVDVEKIGDERILLAKKFFHTDEYNYLLSCAEEDKSSEFYRLWTLKESFMKATGLGFKLPLNEFCIIFDGDKIGVNQSVDNKIYNFFEYKLDGYKLSVCAAEKIDEKLYCVSL